MKAVVTGMIATFPLGGVVWDYGQYVLGLEQLGFEVTYLEDAGIPGYDPRRGTYEVRNEYGATYLPAALAALSPSLADRWHLRTAEGTTYGMPSGDLLDAIADADLFLNVSGAALVRPEYRRAARRMVLIDTDPGWNHFVEYAKWDAGKRWPEEVHGYRDHDVFFTYAESIGRQGCLIPSLGLDWHPTRPPVVLDLWKPEGVATTWTTVMTWDTFRQPIEHDGATYGTKEREFPKVEDLPRRVNVPLEIAISGTSAPTERWRGLGWSVRQAEVASGTPDEYRSYVQRSRGEFSVAKNVYVATNSGWFSCRSACYLAAGRPVVLQDTGWSQIVPSGDGLLPFTTIGDAGQALRAVERDYEAHSAAARDIACTTFDSRRVLGDLVDRALRP